jgi:hypothetical protein
MGRGNSREGGGGGPPHAESMAWPHSAACVCRQTGSRPRSAPTHVTSPHAVRPVWRSAATTASRTAPRFATWGHSAGEGRDVSSWYGVRDAACPVGTRRGGGGGARYVAHRDHRAPAAARESFRLQPRALRLEPRLVARHKHQARARARKARRERLAERTRRSREDHQTAQQRAC